MHSLHCIYRGKVYYFNSITGWLISRKANSNILRNTPRLTIPCQKAEFNLNIVLNPFLTNEPKGECKSTQINRIIKYYAKLLIWLHRYFYPGIYLLSKFRFEIFADGVVAADIFCNIHPQNQRVLCLPRSVFIATTSKKFKQSGTMFIGAFLPSRHMHAWIIEDGINVYRHDYIWTNFTPISIMIWLTYRH